MNGMKQLQGELRLLGRAVTACVVALVVAMPSAQSADVSPYSGIPLQQAANKAGVLMGAAVSPRYLNDPQAVDILARDFGSVTAENEMKWPVIHPAPGVWNFGPADRLVKFAQEHGMAVKGHTFLWSGALPGWVSAINDPTQLKAVIEDHMRVLLTRYKGKVDRWDVINEPFLFPSPVLNPTNHFLQILGPDYFDWAFQTAHAIDPDAKFSLNEVFQEVSPATADAELALLASLVARGTPITLVGIQAHQFAGKPLACALYDFVSRVRALGLEASITELDAASPPQGQNPATAPAAGQDPLDYQAENYYQVASEFLAAGGSDITTWGFLDKYSWLGASTHALLWDDNYQPKPSAKAVRDAFLDYAAAGPGATNACETNLPLGLNHPPKAILSPDKSGGGKPLAVNFTVSMADQDPADSLSYALDFGDGTGIPAGASAPAQAHTYLYPGTYWSKLTVADSAGGKTTRYATITVSDRSPPVAVLTASPLAGATPLTVNFDGSQSSDPDADDSIVSYTFDFGDGSAPVTQADAAVSHTYTAAGMVTATLTVKNELSKQSANTASVQIRVGDSDGDGVPDTTDQCLGTPAGQAVDANGCSAGQLDTDGDGVKNDVDACPNVAGPASNGGCPLSNVDSDGDGIPDRSDNCPTVPNRNQRDKDGDGLGDACDSVDDRKLKVF